MKQMYRKLKIPIEELFNDTNNFGIGYIPFKCNFYACANIFFYHYNIGLLFIIVNTNGFVSIGCLLLTKSYVLFCFDHNHSQH